MDFRRVRARGALAALAVAAVVLLGAAAAHGAQFIYLSENPDGSNVGRFTVGPEGQPIASLDPLATAGDAGNEGLAVSPDGRLVFVVGQDDELWTFSVNQANGNLTPVSGTPTAIGTDPYGVTISPDGRRVYTGDGEGVGRIYGFAVSATGQLTTLPNSPYEVSTTSAEPRGLAMAPDGRHLYAADEKDAVRAFSVAANGSLAQLGDSPYAIDAGAQPFAVTISPDGRFVYLPSRSLVANQIDAFAVAANGTLDPLDGSPFPASGDNLFGGTVGADGEFLYTAGFESDSLGIFSLAANGVPTEIPGSPVPVPGEASAVTTSPTGDRIYVNTYDEQSLYVFDAGSPPTPIDSSPFLTNLSGDFQSVALTPAQPPVAALTVTRDGNNFDFDASASTSDSPIVDYEWDFGDGETVVTMGPQISHAYPDGNFNATVTLTNRDGCSTQFVSAGQTAFCNGSALARAGEAIDTEDPTFSFTFKKKQKLGKTVKINVTCDEDCTLAGSGKEKLEGADKKKVKLKDKTLELAEGDSKNLKMKLAKKPKKISADARKGKATIKMEATDEAGNSSKANAKVRLK